MYTMCVVFNVPLAQAATQPQKQAEKNTSNKRTWLTAFKDEIASQA